MQIWGACWGVALAALLCVVLGEPYVFWWAVFGAIFGALAGWSLQRVLRGEWLRWYREQLAKDFSAQLEVAAASAAAARHQPPVADGVLAESAASVAVATPPTLEPNFEPVFKPTPDLVLPPKRRLLSSSAQQQEALLADVQNLGVVQPAATQNQSDWLSAQAPSLTTGHTGQPAWLQAAQNWLSGGNVVVRLGVFLLFIGLAFLAKYAVQAGLFPPPLRVASIAAVGVALLMVGWKITSASNARRQQYALTLQGAGVAVLYLSVYAALRLYGLLTPTAAFALLAAVAGLGAVLALAQGSQVLAFIGFAGGFAAPVLASSGGGQFVLLFSYYLLLNVVLVGLAYARAWRALNLLGFGFSFAVLGAWVMGSYQPSNYAQVQPFVLAYFALYVLAALFYALRHSLAPRRALDATLLFGVPAATMGIQSQLVDALPYGAAWSAVGMAGFYAALSMWTHRQASLSSPAAARAVIARWLGESYLALALVFLTLAVPLALDAPWTAAIWALEGAAVYWVGQRQGHWFPRLMGLALQPLALCVFWDADIASATAAVLHPRLPGLLILAAAAGLMCYWLHLRERYAAARQASLAALTGWSKAAAAWVDALERVAVLPLFALGLWSWLEAGVKQITRYISDASRGDGGYAWISGAYQTHAMLAFLALTAFALHFAARPQRRQALALAAAPTALLLPALLIFAGLEAFSRDAFWQNAGWLAWPLSLAAYVYALRGVDGSQAGKSGIGWGWVHAGSWPVLALLLVDTLDTAVRHWGLKGSAWDDAAWPFAALVLLAALGWVAYARHYQVRDSWPWQPYSQAWLRWGQNLLALCLLGFALVLALDSSGDSAPLPYLPLLNPTDATLILAALALWAWQRRTQGGAMALQLLPQRAQRWGLALWGFVVLNTIWLRVVHHGWDLPWDSDALYGSFVTQAGYSILWTLLALGMMLLAARRSRRSLWLAGAGLLGLTVLKLLLVDLSNSGGAERIISFIAVGGLMLVVGYFVPLPAKVDEDDVVA